MPTVFYAWQSDTPRAINQDFIRSALAAAVKQVNADLQIDDALDVDSDTQGVPGSPPVAETILEKIDACLIFVADLTLIGKSIPIKPKTKAKRLPNANVLIELGYALGKRGHGILIQVMNAHYGPPEALPFDLAHRRHPIKYTLAPDATEQEKERANGSLAGRLRGALRTILDDNAKARSNLLASLPSEKYVGQEVSPGVLKEGYQRFEKRVSELGLTPPPHGAFEVALQVFGYPNPFHPDREFLELITRVNPQYRDWPLWMNPELLTDPSLKPKVRDGLWETALILLDNKKWRAPSIDYWFASPMGRFYHRRGFWEDGLWPVSGHRAFEPRAALDLGQQVAIVAEAFIVGQAFAIAMGVPEAAPHIEFAFRWTGLKNRILVSSTQQRLFLDELRAEDDEALTICYLPVKSDRVEILSRVLTVIRPLANKFDGYAPNERVTKETADAFLDRRLVLQ